MAQHGHLLLLHGEVAVHALRVNLLLVLYICASRCVASQDDFESSLECFKQSLQLKPDYGEARMWWDKASLRSGYKVLDSSKHLDGAASVEAPIPVPGALVAASSAEPNGIAL
jgi:hypothetical protein